MRYTRLINKKIKSQALLLTISISLVIFLITSGLFLLNLYDNYFLSNYIVKHQAQINLNSGTEIILSNPYNFRIEKTEAISEKNQVVLKVKKWGLYDIGTVESFIPNDTLKRSFLIGYKKEQKLALDLWHSDSKLKIAGNTKLIGNVNAPNKIAERAYITGKPFVGKQLVQGNISASPKNKKKELPSFSFSTYNTDVFLENEKKKIVASFLSEPILLSGRNWKNYDSIIGHVIIESTIPIVIPPSKYLDNVLIKAPYVIIKRGFKGSVQVIATDSIRVERDVELNFPSTLMVKGYGQESSRIFIEEDCHIKGIIALENPKSDIRKQYIGLAENTEVIGQVYCHGLLSLKATVTGEINAYKIITSTKGSVYYNTLIDVEVNAKKLEDYAIFAIGDDAKILKYLE